MLIKTLGDCEPYFEALRKTPAGINPRSLAQALGISIVELYESASRDPAIREAFSNDSYRNQIARYENVRDACLSLQSRGIEVTRKTIAEALNMNPSEFINRIALPQEIAEFFGVSSRRGRKERQEANK